jgi:predicted TIM-barrel fold metal-dependent hydrolase
MAYAGPIIDAHMHLWDLDKHYYSWLQDVPLPNNPAGDMALIAGKNYLPADYAADALPWRVQSLVHVECGLPTDKQLSETDWLEGLIAANAPIGAPIGAIVAGANLDDPAVEALLEAHASRAHVRGVRQIVNFHKDPAKTYGPSDLLQNDQWRAGFGLLAKYGLSFDLQLYPSQMETAAALADAHPAIPLIVNHAGMPTDRDEDGLALWRAGLAMVDRAWTVESLRPFVEQVIETFGVERTMFASNFPVEKVHGSFDAFYCAYDAITAGFSEAERERLFAGSAAAAYRIA